MVFVQARQVKMLSFGNIYYLKFTEHKKNLQLIKIGGFSFKTIMKNYSDG
jgi:hypothetical protein